MKRIPLVILTFLLLTNVSWASCPSGQEENDRTGHCEPIEGIQQRSARNLTFETLGEGYCYYHDKPVSIESRRSGVFRFVYRFNCDELGGVLFDRQDCAIKDNRREGNTAFCLQAKENQNIKKVMAEYDIRQHILNTKRLAEKAKLVALRKISNSYCFVLPAEQSESPPDAEAEGATNSNENSNATKQAEHTRKLRADLLESWQSAKKALDVGWCVTDQVKHADRISVRTNKVSGSYCTAKNGILFPEEECWEPKLNRCETLSDSAARAVLRDLGESEAYFLLGESECNEAGGIVFEAKDCLKVTGSSFVAGGSYCAGVSKQQKADLIARSKVSESYASTSVTLATTASSSNAKKLWCARITGVTYEDMQNCTKSGEWFVYRSSAENEHKRLKDSSIRGKIRLALFPWSLSNTDSGRSGNYHPSQTITEDFEIINGSMNLFETVFSYYPLKRHQYKKLSRSHFDGNLMSETWTFFGKPYIENVVKYGKQIGVDAVLLYRLVDQNSLGNDRLTIFLIDVNTEEMFSETSRHRDIKSRDFYPLTARVFQRFEVALSNEKKAEGETASEKVWCASRNAVSWANKYTCWARYGGKAFPTESEALAEYKRLRATSTSTDATSIASSSSSGKVWCLTAGGVINLPNTDYGKEACHAATGKVFASKALAKAEQTRRLRAGLLESWQLAKKAADEKAVQKLAKKKAEEEAARLLAKKKAEEEAARLLAKKKAEEEAARLLAKKKAEEEAARQSAKTASLTVRSNVAGDKVYIDGVFKGSTRLDLDLPKGKHEIKIEKEGYEAYEEVIDLVDNLIIKGILKKIVENPVQTTTAQRTSADNSALELAFWQSIKDSDEPEMYLEYLRQFPTGVYAGLAKLRVTKEAKSIAARKVEQEAAKLTATGKAGQETSAAGSVPILEPIDRVFVVSQPINVRDAPQVLATRVGRITVGDTLTALGKVKDEDWYFVEYGDGERGYVFAPVLSQVEAVVEQPEKVKKPEINYGKYYAIVIGNNTYRTLPDLHTAVNDARAVGALLEMDYGFEVEVLTNATRSETFSAFSKIRRKVGAKDNLLIYYAGHGWLDKEVDEGYWMPVDAAEEDSGNWISSSDIVAAARRSKAKHLLVVADSCFSGTLTRGLSLKTRAPDYLQRIVAKKARTALTSGGLEPVMDSGGGNHSVFAQAFLSILKQNTVVLDGHQLFTVLRKRVVISSEQTPEYGDIRKAGHDGGDFLFVRQ